MKIEKKNEVYIRIETEPHIARELSEYFTFEVPGARIYAQLSKQSMGWKNTTILSCYWTNLFGIVTIHQRIL